MPRTATPDSPDVEVEDPSVPEDEEAANDIRYEILSYGADYPVDGLVKRLDQGDIFIPSFQRDYVWRLPQASRFIESLLLGLPVPAIFLSKEPDSGRLMVIDGQQRLKSLQFFYGGLFGGREFNLHGVTQEFEGRSYRTLDAEDRRRLDDAILHAIVVRQENPQDDDSSIYMVFERLNTTSTALSPQEIRACVYHGPFNEYLGRANENADWREIFGSVSPRQKDRELLLRFFALYFDAESYKTPMKVFLNNFMDKNRQLQPYGEALLNEALVPTVELINRTIGPSAFRPQRALNTAVTDALLVGAASRLATGEVCDLEGFKQAAMSVLRDDTFQQLYRSDTTDAGKIRERIDRVRRAISAVA